MAGWNGKMLACYIPYHSRDHLQVSACIVVTYGGFVCIFSCLYINTDFFFIILLTYSCSYLLSSHWHFVLFALLLSTMIHKYIIEDGGGESGRRWEILLDWTGLCAIAQKQAYTKDKAIRSHMICLNDHV